MDESANNGGCLWSDAPAPSAGWDSWQPDLTTGGGGDGWGDSADQSAFPGFRQDDVESSDPSSSATSSDSGTAYIDMSDLQPLTDAQASEHVFWQYRTHRRRWRRLTGKPVRRFRRHVRYFVKRRGKGKGQRHGFGFGGRRRSYVVTQDGIRAYLGARGKGGARGSGRGHGRKRNPRGRDGTVMTCRICNSEELVGAKCTQGQGRGAGAAQPPAFPAFHALASMSESRRVAGQLTWQGVGGDDSVDVPVAPSLQELTTAGEDHIFHGRER